MQRILTSLLFLLLFSLSSMSFAQSFQAYYQQNYKWDGRNFIKDSPSLTNTRFTFNGNQVQIDNSKFTITNSITNSSGEFLTATANNGSNIEVSISLTNEKDVKGRIYHCITVERKHVYKIIYYLDR